MSPASKHAAQPDHPATPGTDTGTGTEPLLSIRDLKVSFRTESGMVPALHGIDLDVFPGEVLALVGESGSGKSVTSLAVMGLLPTTAKISGSIRLGERELLTLSESQLNDVRGSEIGMIFQEPMTALNPTMRIGAQVAEAIRNHENIPAAAAWDRAVDLLRRVGIPEPDTKAKGFPHEMSGGQRQRVVIAIALACKPRMIIADEPTTALDVTVQAEILDLIRELAADSGTAFLLVTHNMGVVADVASRVAVMLRGDMVEVDSVDRVLLDPQADYTRRLLAAVPRLPEANLVPDDASGAAATPVATLRVTEAGRAAAAALPSSGGADSGAPVAPATPALEVKNARLSYRSKGVEIRALDDVSLSVAPGEILGLVAESGSGKSTFGRAALGLIRIDSGEVNLLGTPMTGRWRNERAERKIRANVGVIFQDPGSSIDPRVTVGQAIAEPMQVQPHLAPATRALRAARVRSLLESVELPADYADRYPHELSGGQRQRVGLARAVALEPTLLVADEPTSALDVSVQATVLRLLSELQERIGFACLFISHDLAVVHQMADRVAVLQRGRVVEVGPVEDVLINPSEDYSRRLLAAVPVPDPHAQALRREARWEGNVDDAA